MILLTLSFLAMHVVQCNSAIALNYDPSSLARATFIQAESRTVYLKSGSSPSVRSRRKKKAQCRDRKDNDKDGLIDYPSDPGCTSRRDKRERNSSGGDGGDGGGGDGASGETGAGASLGGRRPFPDSNPWNQVISMSLLIQIRMR